MPFVFHPLSALTAFLNKPSSLLCAAFFIEAAGFSPKSEFYGRECCNNNWAMRDSFKYCKRKGPLIELGGEAILIIRINNHSCTEYGRIPRYGHSGSPSEGDSHTILARARETSMVKAPIHIAACHLRSAIHSKFRKLGNSIPIKELTKGMSGRGSLLDAVQLAETLGTAGVRSPQVSIL
ncbi:NADH dehydrogenase subunit 4 [Capsicum annuum]|nr:NADH dehydrogenase subunit 4 [Capsicum annuum]